MVDFHTHILPKIDDGSPDTETSVKMLKSLYEQGINKVALTPHFYITRDNLTDFLRRRDKSVSALRDAVKDMDNIPKAVLGAEVLLFPEISGMDNLSRLCLEGTNYMLIEMPFAKWSNVTYDTLGKLRANGILPIIAHIERYMKIQKDKGMIYYLMDLGCIIQANGSYFTSAMTRRKATKLLLSECIHLIGSDCHDLKMRKPNTGEAYAEIEKRAGSYGIEALGYTADMVLQNATYCF